MTFPQLSLTLVSLLGGMALFLHGLEFSAQAFRKGLGSNAKTMMELICRRRWGAFLFGCILALFTQSTTAATTFAVGLVDLGVLPFIGSLLVMMGASVGTTFIVFLFNLDVTFWSPLGLAVGTALVRFSSSQTAKVGALLQGVSLVLMGLGFIKTGVAPLEAAGILNGTITAVAGSPILTFFVSLILTALVQSSVPILGVAVILASSGILPALAILPIVLGSRLGAVVLVLLAGLGAKRNAKALSIATACFRVVGVVIILPLAPWLSPMLDRLCGNNVALQVSWTQFFVGWLNVVFMVPLAPRLGSISLRLAGTTSGDVIGQPRAIAPQHSAYPALAIPLLAQEMTRLAAYLEKLAVCLVYYPDQKAPLNDLAAGIPDLSTACASFVASIRGEEDAQLHREHVILASAMEPLNELGRVMIKHLCPLAPYLYHLRKSGKKEDRPSLTLLEKLLDVLRDALAAFALGDVSMYQIMKNHKEIYQHQAAHLRSDDAEAQTVGRATREEQRQLISICDRLALLAEELAWSGVLSHRLSHCNHCGHKTLQEEQMDENF